MTGACTADANDVVAKWRRDEGDPVREAESAPKIGDEDDDDGIADTEDEEEPGAAKRVAARPAKAALEAKAVVRITDLLSDMVHWWGIGVVARIERPLADLVTNLEKDDGGPAGKEAAARQARRGRGALAPRAFARFLIQPGPRQSFLPAFNRVVAGMADEAAIASYDTEQTVY